MLILRDRGNSWWAVFAGVAGVAGWIAYRLLGGGDPVAWTGGRLPGLWFGIVAALLLLLVETLWAIRHRSRKGWWIFPRRIWLRAHIWLGFLGIWLALLHCGFRWGGLVEQWTWLLLASTGVTGVLGLVFQRYLPRRITRLLPEEIPHNQIPQICDSLRRDADAAVERICGRDVLDDQFAKTSAEPTTRDAEEDVTNANERFARFYLDEVRPFLTEPRGGRSRMRQQYYADARFERMAALPLPADMKTALAQMREMCQWRRSLLRLDRVHAVLRGWLAFHIAASLAFWILVATHVVTTILY